MPVYWDKSKRCWRVVIWSRGQRHDSLVRGRKASALEHEAAERLRLNALDPTTERAGLSLATLCERYLLAQRDLLRTETWRVRKSQLATVCDALGKLRARDVTTARVEDYKAMRSRSFRRTSKRVAPKLVERSTINNELRALVRVLAWSRDAGYRVADPKVKRMRQDKPRVCAWTDGEMQRLYSAARATSPVLLSMLICLANTGMRRSEWLAAEWSWIDWDAGFVRIPCTSNWGPKSRRAREVPLEPAVRAVLGPMRRDSGPVFLRPCGARYMQWPKDWWIPCRNAAGLKGGVHQLRHTYASHFLARKPDIFLLGQVLGQSHATTTEQYSHLLPSHLEQARGVVSLVPSLRTVPGTVPVDKMAHRRRSKTG